MTGSVSTFADVALNFGAPAVKGDSVLRAAKARGRRSVMYGDDTWLRLFPGLWAESDGTTSFYVTDYTEVRWGDEDEFVWGDKRLSQVFEVAY